MKKWKLCDKNNVYLEIDPKYVYFYHKKRMLGYFEHFGDVEGDITVELYPVDSKYNNFLDNMKNKKCTGINEENKIKEYIKADIRLVKIQNILILIATILMALIVVLFTIRAMYSVRYASASVRTTATVLETHLNSAGWDKVRYRDGFVYYKL